LFYVTQTASAISSGYIRSSPSSSR